MIAAWILVFGDGLPGDEGFQSVTKDVREFISARVASEEVGVEHRRQAQVKWKVERSWDWRFEVGLKGDTSTQD